MSSRFHNKYHRHNHHTQPINDPRYPDASHDPIASPESPFLGPFVLSGPLSANSSNGPAGIFSTSLSTNPAVLVHGSIHSTEGLQISGIATVSEISFTGDVLNTYSSSLITTSEFLQVTVNGVNRYIRLWDFLGTGESLVVDPPLSGPTGQPAPDPAPPV